MAQVLSSSFTTSCCMALSDSLVMEFLPTAVRFYITSLPTHLFPQTYTGKQPFAYSKSPTNKLLIFIGYGYFKTLLRQSSLYGHWTGYKYSHPADSKQHYKLNALATLDDLPALPIYQRQTLYLWRLQYGCCWSYIVRDKLLSNRSLDDTVEVADRPWKTTA